MMQVIYEELDRQLKHKSLPNYEINLIKWNNIPTNNKNVDDTLPADVLTNMISPHAISP